MSPGKPSDIGLLSMSDFLLFVSCCLPLAMSRSSEVSVPLSNCLLPSIVKEFSSSETDSIEISSDPISFCVRKNLQNIEHGNCHNFLPPRTVRAQTEVCSV